MAPRATVQGAWATRRIASAKVHRVNDGEAGERSRSAGVGSELFSTCVALLFDELTDEDRGEQGGGALG